MTNEELERKAAELGSQVAGVCYDDFGAGRAAEILAPALRALVSEAYEEAAQVADRIDKETDDWAEREGLPLDYGGDPRIAAEIRDLKASLEPEPVGEPPSA